MKDKLRSINNISFLTCLAILLLNDFYLKEEYHNWLTGKLSDVCGLYVFVLLWTAIFPNRKRTIHFSTAILFVVWKSPYSQGLIDFFSEHLYPIHRIIDATDLIALLILPVAFFYEPVPSLRFNLNPIPVALLSFVAFCATSVPAPRQAFTQPQYILFKSGIIQIQDRDFPSDYDVHEVDSFLIIRINKIVIDKRATLEDEYHKAQILKDVDLRLLRQLQDGYPSSTDLSHYITLRDSLIVAETFSVTLEVNSITEKLNFKNTRLHGKFMRFSSNGQLLIDGKFRNGIEDSVWSFYNNDHEITSTKHFQDGELIRTEVFGNGKPISVQRHNTRQEVIRNKYFHLAIIALLIIALIAKLVSNYKKSTDKNIVSVSGLSKIAGSFGLPIAVCVVARLISSVVPISHSNNVFWIFEAVIVYIFTVPLFLLVFYYLRLRSKFDLVYYLFLFSLIAVFVQEWMFLGKIRF